MNIANALAATTLALAGLLPFGAAAQDAAAGYPSKPILIVVPQTPGGAGDIYSRLYSQKIGEATGWRFIVDNKAGAGAALGTNFAAKAPADGYTLLNASSSLTANPLIFKDAPDPVKTFQAVSLLTKAASMLLVRTNFPARNFQEYVAYAKKNPGKINFGTSGIGSIIHLNGLWLNRLAGAEVTYIPYKGTGDIFTAMLSGELDATLGAMTVNLPLVKDGKARSLGISTLERNSVVPDMPPLAELGARGFEYDAWSGIVAHAAVPRPIIQKLNAEFQKAGRHPEVVKRLSASGQDHGGSTVEDFQSILVRETERWRTLATDAYLNLQQE